MQGHRSLEMFLNDLNELSDLLKAMRNKSFTENSNVCQ